VVSAAIPAFGGVGMQFRIGDRDPVTGLYDVIYPDGSHTRNGIKIFNSAHEFGDVVSPTERSDGMMILDGVKATLTEVVTNRFGLNGFGEKPVGYLAGQVFNDGEEVILPTVSIEFAPGSPEELAPGAGDFVVRIKIDRPQRRDLRVKCELSGTAASGDYAVAGLDGDSIAIIPAGAEYFDVAITPTQNQSGASETVVVTVVQSSGYRIGQSNNVSATIVVALPFITFTFAPASPTQLFAGSGSFVIRVSVDTPQIVDLDVGCTLTSYDGLTFASFTSSSFYTGFNSSTPRFILPANSTYVDLVISPNGSSIPFLLKTLYFQVFPDSSTPPKYDAFAYGYLELNVVNASIFIAKYRPYSLPTLPAAVHPTKIYGSNVKHTDLLIEMTPGRASPNEQTRLAKLPIDLTSIAPSSLGDSAIHRLRVLDQSNPINSNQSQRPVRYIQFDLKLAKIALDALSLRYLYIFVGGWAGHSNNQGYQAQSFGTHSAQISTTYLPTLPAGSPLLANPSPNVLGEYFNPVPFGEIIYNQSEYTQEYLTSPYLACGWIDHQYLRVTNAFNPNELVQLKVFCVRIDMQNLLDITYVNPVPVSVNPATDQANRPQVVNY
jgi:hypothetical protein